MSTSKTRKPRKILVNFTTEEDVALCEANIAITGDGSVDKIVPLFSTKTNGNPIENDKDSLENRNCAIKKDIRLFFGILGKLYRGRSGWASEDLLIHSRIEYMKVFKKPFGFDECYELYKYEPGFDYKTYTDAPPPPPPAKTIVQNIDTDATQNMDTDVEVITKKQRGPEKKYLKAQKQANYLRGTLNDSIETVFSESNKNLLSYLKEQEDAYSQQSKEENERYREDKLKEREQNLMMVDMSKLSPESRLWLQPKQREIFENNLVQQSRE
ncbi:hypothetical protein MKX01_021726 [Papaver californicum]|nr:hypothetical protein MKX01_021726 [Papaver californicum]